MCGTALRRSRLQRLAGEVFARPEVPLLGQLVAIARAERISAAALLLFLGWTDVVSQGDVLGWIALVRWDRRASVKRTKVGANLLLKLRLSRFAERAQRMCLAWQGFAAD
jgi:hypothetical protein